MATLNRSIEYGSDRARCGLDRVSAVLDPPPEGQLVFNNVRMVRKAALEGLGLAFLPDDQVVEAVADGRLVHVLADWCEPFPGYHLYYPSRRQQSPAFALIVEALRYRD